MPVTKTFAYSQRQCFNYLNGVVLPLLLKERFHQTCKWLDLSLGPNVEVTA